MSRTDRTTDVIVAGAGHNGLTAAAYLARAGLDVLVVEAAPVPGGMTVTSPMEPEAPGFRINEASIFASAFGASTVDRDLGLGKRFGLRSRVIDPAHLQLNYDGSSLALWRDPRRTADELRHFSSKDADALLDLYRVIDAAFEIGLPMLQTSPVRPEIRNVMRAAKATIKNRRELVALGRWVYSSHLHAIEESFEHDVIKAALLIQLPFTPLDSDLGAWALMYFGILRKFGCSMFEGGTGALPAALLASLAADGGRIRCDSPVEQLVTRGNRVIGVQLRGGEELYAGRGVLTAFSPKKVLRDLLPPGLLAPKLETRAKHIPTRTRRIADYGLNVALRGQIKMTKVEKWRGDGLDCRPPANSYHTYEQTVAAWRACVRGEIPQHVPGLAQITTAWDPSMAPEGSDIFWFWSGLTPSDPQADWSTVRDQLTNTIIEQSSHYYEGLDELEIARRPRVLPDIEERFWALDGSVYHTDPVITRTGPLKPAAGFAGYRTPVPGLYLTGSGTHPVAGISGLPGQNAARTMLKDFRRQDKDAKK